MSDTDNEQASDQASDQGGDRGGDSQDPGTQPEPTLDAPPEPAPGGPADRVVYDEDDLPPATPDQPRSAQVEEHNLPDEIEQPESLDEEEKDVEPGDEAPA